MFKFIGKMVSGPVSRIIGQATKLDDEVLSPVKTFQNQLQGEVWTGADADKFAEEIQRDLLPKVQNVIAAIAGVQSPFTKISDAVGSTDDKMMGMAQNLGDVFDGIF